MLIIYVTYLYSNTFVLLSNLIQRKGVEYILGWVGLCPIH